MRASYQRHLLKFKRPSGTSRGVLREKETWLIKLEDEGRVGVGECGLLRGLSCDDLPDYEEKLSWVCKHIHLGFIELYDLLANYPSIQMGLECAFLSLNGKDPFTLFSNPFSNGDSSIPINGLIWMGDEQFMIDQVKEKIDQGFRCIKMKVGAISFDKEVAILKAIRANFNENQIVLRVDANGAFGEDAFSKLSTLAELSIHSIEQPIPKGNLSSMRKLCAQTPLPIALDEELIGVVGRQQKIDLLDQINPQYIILKPSFIGGLTGAEEWFNLAKERNINTWVTSALESNIGLNAIAQWTAELGFDGFQGLGTGSLFTNNFSSPLAIKNGYLSIHKNTPWIPIEKIFS